MRGNGRIFKRANSSAWWIAYCQCGKEIRESAANAIREAASRKRGKKITDEDARKVAEQLLVYKLRKVANDLEGVETFVSPKQNRVLVSELLDDLESDLRLPKEGRPGPARSLPGIRSHLKRVRAAFGDRRAVGVTEEAVDRYIETRLEDGAALATVNRETGLLAQAFKLAVGKKIVKAPKVRKMSESANVRQGFFEKAEFGAVLANLPSYLQGLVHFGYLSGWRKGEILSLAWTDVDMAGRVIRLRPENSKNGKGRVLVLDGTIGALIERQWRLRELEQPNGTVGFSLYVFHQGGSPVGSFRKAWASACKLAGVEGRLFHDLRRTAIRNMVRAGVGEKVAMSISGHRTRAVFDRYNIVNEDDLRQAMQKTQEYLEAVPASRKITRFEQPPIEMIQ